ncbi:MAG: hypothetical protein J6J31_04780 [Thermoguttaceae bacterium]|nr:hypothetical protein [Thermoguttaceae bacterium]
MTPSMLFSPLFQSSEKPPCGSLSFFRIRAEYTVSIIDICIRRDDGDPVKDFQKKEISGETLEKNKKIGIIRQKNVRNRAGGLAKNPILC